LGIKKKIIIFECLVLYLFTSLVILNIINIKFFLHFNRLVIAFTSQAGKSSKKNKILFNKNY